MAPKTIDTFLQQQRSLSQERPLDRRLDMDSKAEAALACLPQDTPVCQYENPSQMEAAARAVDDGGYCVFLDVPERIIFDDRKKMGIGRTEYFQKPKILVAKMVTHAHEYATSWLQHEIDGQMRDMGMRYRTHLKDSRTANIEHKEPDCAMRPRNLPSGRSDEWPTLVMETGKSETHKALDRDAKWWIQQSAGDVKTVITVKISPTKMTIQRYGQSGTVLQTITVRKLWKRRARVTGGPLRIPFADVFLRAPCRNQGDFVFTHNDLEDWANDAWESF